MIDDEIPKHYRKKGKKRYTIERRMIPQKYEGSIIQRLGWDNEWKTYKRYESEKDRDRAMKSFEGDKRFEYRLPLEKEDKYGSV